MNVLITILFTLFLSLSAFAGIAQASGTSCSGFYGGSYTGSTSCNQITIDKKVQKPDTKDYVDNLSALDPKYQAGNEVIFQIVVKNTGTDKLTNIVVIDSLPQFVTFVAGPGSYDKDANKLTFVIASLESDQSQTVFVKTKIAENVTFQNNGFTCVTNIVRGTQNSNLAVEDSSSFCIERPLKVQPPVLGVKQTPPTGPEAAALPILLGMGGFGWFLRKKTVA